VSRYQKGKTNLDFTEARDSEWHWNPLGRMQVCICKVTTNLENTEIQGIASRQRKVSENENFSESRVTMAMKI